ncbi:signal peptide protein [Peterkaempfera bronchialis]|uniref:signal peptide protein n=1 Tax=Peterkaempfera bronchialis TaxID=2126346 RepID=UPI003C2D7185
MPRSTKRTAVTVATTLLVTGGAVFAATTASGATAAPAHRNGTAAVREAPAAAPSGFVDLPTRPVANDGRAHEFTVHYRNIGTARVVAPQVLVESPDAGPYLAPGDVRLEQFDVATQQWTPVPLETQTGTLYTAIPATGRLLPSGADLDVQYRLTVEPAGVAAARQAVIQPRIVLFGSGSGPVLGT